MFTKNIFISTIAGLFLFTGTALAKDATIVLHTSINPKSAMRLSGESQEVFCEAMDLADRDTNITEIEIPAGLYKPCNQASITINGSTLYYNGQNFTPTPDIQIPGQQVGPNVPLNGQGTPL